jgi:HAE1 family hydrophobic/amphiphilic exporter-1
LPGYRFQVISNQGIFIRQAIGEVINSALLGMLLAVLVLFFFLRRVGTTLIVSLSIPDLDHCHLYHDVFQRTHA